MINLGKQIYPLNFRKARLLLGFFILLFLFSGCRKPNESISITGQTMGTTYSVKIINNIDQSIDFNNVRNEIDSVLNVVNQQMSTYIEDSEINRFNQLEDNSWFPVSFRFFKVILMAQEVSRLTDGAFDITVGPLVDLWGFGINSEKEEWQPPSERQIQCISKLIGYQNISTGKFSIKKNNPDTEIDVNAIAKGFGVDIVFELLEQKGFTDILVEIGGEVRCKGHNSTGKPWQIGIDKPILSVAPGKDLQSIISLNNNALATSGDYRNYFKYEGKIYSHTIDPRTGYQTQNQVASTSVTAPTCMQADALATALMVMGEPGMKIIESLENVEALLIIRKSEIEFNSIKSSGWLEN